VSPKHDGRTDNGIRSRGWAGVITVELFSGRTLEQKRAFVAEVTDTTVRILKLKPEAGRPPVDGKPRSEGIPAAS
jgi:hypothetical protein